MEKVWIIAIVLSIINSFLFWRLTNNHFEKQYGVTAWNKWGTRFYYWQVVIYIGVGLAVVMMFLLRWANVLSF